MLFPISVAQHHSLCCVDISIISTVRYLLEIANFSYRTCNCNWRLLSCIDGTSTDMKHMLYIWEYYVLTVRQLPRSWLATLELSCASSKTVSSSSATRRRSLKRSLCRGSAVQYSETYFSNWQHHIWTQAQLLGLIQNTDRAIDVKNTS